MRPGPEDSVSLEALYAQSPDDGQRAWLLNRKALELEEADPAQMLDFATRAREFSARAGDREAWAFSCRNAGVARHHLAQPVEAEADLRAALVQFEELNHTEGIALTVGNLAVVHQDEGRFDSALELHLRCLKLYGQLGDERGRARTMLHTAEIYAALQEDERAIDYCEQCLSIARKWDDQQMLGSALASIGTIYGRLGMVDRALEYQQESLAMKEATGNTMGIAIGLGNIGALQAARKRTMEALGMYELSLQLREEIGDRRGMAAMLHNIGDLHAQQGKHDRALVALRDALNIAGSLHLSSLQQRIHIDCAGVEEALGNIPKAHAHLKAAIALMDDGQHRAHLKHVAALELEYDRAQHRTLDGLQNRVYDLEHTALRSQVNPHFLHNALSSIQFFLTNNDRESAHRYLARLGRLLRLALEHARVPLITLAEEIEAVRLYVRLEELRFGDRFSCTIDIDEEIDIEEILVPPMLVQPFVENALHHGLLPKAAQGVLQISISQASPSTLSYLIQDNGVGRAASARMHAARQGDRHRSIGITLISDRLMLLGTRVGAPMHAAVTDLVDGEGEPAGTRVDVSIPSTLRHEDVR